MFDEKDVARNGAAPRSPPKPERAIIFRSKIFKRDRPMCSAELVKTDKNA